MNSRHMPTDALAAIYFHILVFVLPLNSRFTLERLLTEYFRRRAPYFYADCRDTPLLMSLAGTELMSHYAITRPPLRQPHFITPADYAIGQPDWH